MPLSPVVRSPLWVVAFTFSLVACTGRTVVPTAPVPMNPPAGSEALVNLELSKAEATAQAAILGTALAHQAATATQVRAAQLQPMWDEQTQVAVRQTQADLQRTEIALTGTALAVAQAQSAATAQAHSQTATATAWPLAATSTALAHWATVAVQATAQAESAARGQVSAWLWAVVPPLGIFVVVATLAAAGYWRLTSETAAKAHAEVIRAQADAEARAVEARAKAQRDYALAAQVHAETARRSVLRVGGTLVRVLPSGEVQVVNVPAEMLAHAPGVGGVASVVEAPAEGETFLLDGEPVDKLSTAQRDLLAFLGLCITLNGPQSNVIPPAATLDEHGMNRARRDGYIKTLKEMKVCRTTFGREAGGTWLVGYTLAELSAAVRSGAVPLPHPASAPPSPNSTF